MAAETHERQDFAVWNFCNPYTNDVICIKMEVILKKHPGTKIISKWEYF